MSIDDQTLFGKHGHSQLDDIIAEIEVEAASIKQKLLGSKKTTAASNNSTIIANDLKTGQDKPPQTIFYVSSDRRIFTKLEQD